MIIFLSGKDTFRSRAHLKKMTDKFRKDRDPDGYNTVTLDAGKEVDSARVLAEILTIPFLADKRMVVVENLLVAKDKALQGEILRRLEEKTLPESTVVIFWEATDTFKTKDAKALAERLGQEKFSQTFDMLSGIQLSAWVAEEVTDRGGKIARPAVEYIAKHAPDAWQIHTLIDQLIAYAGTGREIGIADAALFLNETVDDSIFNLIDAIVAKQPKNVYQMMREQYRNGEDASYVFAMLVRQFRILIELRDAYERQESLSSDALAKELGLHPFVVKKSLPTMKRYTMNELKDIYHSLLEIDIYIKTGQGQGRDLIDMFVAKLCFTPSPQFARS